MKKILFIIGFVIPFSVLCQNSTKVVPGYLGKKWVIDYTLNVMPSFLFGQPGANTDYDEFGNRGSGFYFNTQHKFGVERVVGRKFSVVGTVLFSNNQADVDVSNGSAEDFLQISERGYIFTLRHYRKHLAPISKYFDYKVGYYDIMLDDFAYSVNDFENGTTESQTVSAESVGDLYLGFGWGKSRVVMDRVIFSYGFELGFLVGGMLDALEGSSEFRQIDPESPNSLRNRDTLKFAARERMFFESLVNFTLRIGFMP